MYRKQSESISDLLKNPNSNRDLKNSHTFNDHIKHFELAMSKYKKLSPYPRQRFTNNVKLEQQYHNFNDHSSSDEYLMKNKSKSTSSIDTESVNNILDEFEDLNYRKSSDISDIDVANVEVTNFKEMMDRQQRESSEKHNSRSFKLKNLITSRNYSHTVSPSKVNRQTQVQQCSRDRQKEVEKKFLLPLDEDSRLKRRNFVTSIQSQEAQSSFRLAKIPPEILLRKGEVQKRVDEWLSQTHIHNCEGFTKNNKGLTRSNSNAEQKSHRRLRQQELRSRRFQLNGSSSYDDLTHDGIKTEPNKAMNNVTVSVGVNTTRGTYKQYLAFKNKSKTQKQQHESINCDMTKPSVILQSRDCIPTTTKIHCATYDDIVNLNCPSSILKRQELNEQVQQKQNQEQYKWNDNPPISVRGKNSRTRYLMENRISSLIKARNEIFVTSEIIKNTVGITKQSSFKPEIVQSFSKSASVNILPNKSLKESKTIAISGICQDKVDGNLILTRREEYDTKNVLKSNAKIESGLDISQEIDGSVSARVHAFQGSNDQLPKLKSLKGSNILIEKRNQSAIPASTNDSFCFKENDRKKGKKSTFKPNFISLNQNNGQNLIKRDREIDLTTKYVEKIYESTLQPEVIHSDNLELIFSPGCTNFVYGDKSSIDVSTNSEFIKKDNNGKQKLVNSNNEFEFKHLESGLNNCLKLLKKSPSFRLKRSNPVHTECYVKSSDNEQKLENEKPNLINSFEILKLVFPTQISQTNIIEGLKETSAKQLASYKKYDLNTYESRSTLKLDNPNKTNSSKENDNNSLKDSSVKQNILKINHGTSNIKDRLKNNTCAGSNIDVLDQTNNVIKEKIDDDTVINEVLVKNLHFKQNLPSSTPPALRPRVYFEPIKKQESASIVEFTALRKQPLNYNSVLNEDNANLHVHSNQHHQQRSNKIYKTMAQLEHKKLMDLLKKGDFNLVKLELERSYTLSTSGIESAVYCPPYSPPPAPSAYISSARASSLGHNLGSGRTTVPPEGDPFGRLIRYLKNFYRELGTRDPPHLPQWALPLPVGTLCSAHFQPHLQIVHKNKQEDRLENIKIDQIFAPVKLSNGSTSDAPRRVSVEGGPGSGRTTLCLRFLYQWATQKEGPVLAFIIPLRELRGIPLLSYLTRELFTRNGYVTQTIQQLWRTLHLLEDNVLFILDGYDECIADKASLSDTIDLLEGRLFPDARVLVTCSVNNATTIEPLIQRRLHLAGLEWSHVERLCVAYFIHNDMAEKACKFLEVLNVQPLSIRQFGQHPLGWIMLCVLYQDSGNLPAEISALVQAAVKCIVKRSMEPSVPSNEEIPGHCRKRLEDFGKLALAALRESRSCYTETEIRTHGGGIEIIKLGFLNRGLTFGQHRKSDFYTPIHLAIAEFLAAYYLTSVAQYANILCRELEGLPFGIINHLAGLLGHKTHLVLNQLCPLEIPPRAMFSLLKAAGASDGNVAAICRLMGVGVGFGPAPNERPSAPLIHTSPLELEGWTRILESSACSLETLEIIFQVERDSDLRYLDEFFRALVRNESVKLVRITSLLGQEFPTEEVLKLAEHVRNVLGKKKLHEFELVITCLEESAHERLECVVGAICQGMSQASGQLSRMVLDMNLSGDQVSRVCKSLRLCNQVQAVHLPHLGCGCEGLTSVADLLKSRPLLALNLAGSWGAKNEGPSSSGISMGCGSGSSGCASITPGGPSTSSRYYSSLPRGTLAPYSSSNRPATLPRLPLELNLGMGIPCTNGNGTLPSRNSDDDRDSSNGSKRKTDSVLCHKLPTLHPLPTCDVISHKGTGFHEIFDAIREANCKLRSLNMSKCLLGSLDAACLGETIRRARNLDAVRAAGASRPGDVMPLVLALADAPCLQLLDLASPRLALDDYPCRFLCHALARNSTLRLLSLEGWTFRIEEWETLSMFSDLLYRTSVRELNLCNARLHLAVHEGPLSRLGRRDDAGAELLKASTPPVCPNVVFLRLAGFQVTVNDRLALRGPLLLPFLAGFSGLIDLDLSLDKSSIGGNNNSLLFIEDRMLVQFFSCLAVHFRALQSLRINFWHVSLEDSTRSLRQIGKHLRNCIGLSFLKAAGLMVTDSTKKTRVEHSFIQTILANLQSLTWLCLDGIELTESQATSIGKCLRESLTGLNLEISAKDVHVKAMKTLVTSVEEGGKAKVLYTGGATCRIKIMKLQKSGKNRKK